jgi:ribonuclease P protein component
VVLAAPAWEGAPRGGRRLGITVTRRVGRAVVRNRLKRYIREGFRKQRSTLPRGTDVVVVARSAAVSLRASEVEQELGRLFASL